MKVNSSLLLCLGSSLPASQTAIPFQWSLNSCSCAWWPLFGWVRSSQLEMNTYVEIVLVAICITLFSRRLTKEAVSCLTDIQPIGASSLPACPGMYLHAWSSVCLPYACSPHRNTPRPLCGFGIFYLCKLCDSWVVSSDCPEHCTPWHPLSSLIFLSQSRCYLYRSI